MFQSLWFASFVELSLLYTVVLFTLIYMLRKYRGEKFYILGILLFYPAFFDFFGKNFQDAYKVVVLAITLWVCFKANVFAKRRKGDGLIIAFFGLFTITFALSAFVGNDSISIIFSQYSRYLITICLWFLIRNELYRKQGNIKKMSFFTFELILMQIIITLGKLVIFGGRQIESLVGSISHIGGAAGTTIPILGFIVLWYYRRGRFSRKDWYFIAGLMLIGFLTGKRAIWFIMPLVIAAFMIYVPRLKINKSFLFGILLAPLAFYLGARLTPTLNPENKVWGSFDINYAFDYAEKYQFGAPAVNQENKNQGRSGATMLLWYKIMSDNSFSIKDWTGRGLSVMYSTDYKEFNELNLGIEHKGTATGVFQSYVTTGYLGIIATVLFFFSMLWKVRTKRIRYVLIVIVAWEYFLYTGIIFRTPAFMFLIIYFIHYTNCLAKHTMPKSPQASIDAS